MSAAAAGEDGPLRVWLDDERPAPAGWTRCYWPEEVIALLVHHDVQELSLDHDLGDDARGCGHDVLLWIEERVATTHYRPPALRVHSANPVGRRRMEAAIRQIARLRAARNEDDSPAP